MDKEDRAKQFLPFDAMKGLHEALLRQEDLSTRVDRIELGEEDVAALSKTLSEIGRGDRIRVTFYRDGHYQVKEDIVLRLDEVKRLISFDGDKILFDDLLAIERFTPKDGN